MFLFTDTGKSTHVTPVYRISQWSLPSYSNDPGVLETAHHQRDRIKPNSGIDHLVETRSKTSTKDGGQSRLDDAWA